MTAHGLDRQSEIYGTGTAPALPLAPEAWEEQARNRLPREAFDYVAGGAGAEETMRANREAFARQRLRPRMLRAVPDRAIAIDILGTRSAAPFLLAPIGTLGIVHAEADLA